MNETIEITPKEIPDPEIARLLSNIPTGAKNSITLEDLAEALDMWDQEQKLLKLIQTSRLSGILICGNEHGYYQPKNILELACFYVKMKERIRDELWVLIPVERMLKDDGTVKKCFQLLCGGVSDD